MAELKLRQRSDELIRKDVAEQFLFATARGVRDNLFNVPDRVQPSARACGNNSRFTRYCQGKLRNV